MTVKYRDMNDKQQRAVRMLFWDYLRRRGVHIETFDRCTRANAGTDMEAFLLRTSVSNWVQCAFFWGTYKQVPPLRYYSLGDISAGWRSMCVKVGIQ